MQSVRWAPRSVLCAVAMFGVAGTEVALAQDPVDPALVEARRQRSNPALSVLTYRHLDELFNTREVATGGQVWALPPSSLTLPDSTPVKIGEQNTTLAAALQDMRINAILVLKDGKLVRELHRNGGDEHDRYAGFSMSKAWISVLFGIAQGQGHIGKVDDKVTAYLPELKGTAYEGVTLEHLLNMRAGTSWVEDYSPGSRLDALRDASTNTETGFYEASPGELKNVTAPGSTYNYSTLDTELLGSIIAKQTGKTISEYMSETIWRPAGMETPGYWIMQGPSGQQHEWYGAGFGATVRDFARLGQMMLDGGKANGRQIVPEAWVKSSTRSNFGDDNYFNYWWGNEGMDGFSARGVGGQHVLIDRPSRTVMVITAYGVKPGVEDLFKSVVGYLDQSHGRDEK